MDEKLIHKLLRGECTEEELAALQRYWRGNEQSTVDEMLRKYWEESANEDEELTPATNERIWTALQYARKTSERESPLQVASKRPRPGRRWLTAAAAAVLLLLTALGGWWWYTSQDPGTPRLVERTNERQHALEIALPDGSTVWLAKNSQLTYPDPFPADERPLELTGEAYFEVNKDAERPFTVRAGKLETRVLGTAFNLRAMPEESEVAVALVEGRVAVRVGTEQDSAIVLTPGEELSFRKADGRLEKTDFFEDVPFAWKDGIIYFHRAKVREVAKILTDWYDRPFRIENEDQIAGALVHRFDANKLTLNEVLHGISVVMDYTFEPQPDGVVVIRPKK